MMRSKPPAYLKAIPIIFAAVVIVFLYGVYSFFAGFESPSAQSSVSQIIEDVEKAVEEIAAEIERVMTLGENIRKREDASKREEAARLARSKQKTSKPRPGPLSEKPEQILDFSPGGAAPRLILRTSQGVSASFVTESIKIKHGEESRTSASAKLSIRGMGPDGGKERFVTGIVELPAPVEVEKMGALEIEVKGEGVKSFNVAIYVKHGEGTAGWSATGLKAGGEFAGVTIPFADFDMWNHNIGKKGYTFPDKWAPPERIEALSFYLRPKDLADGKTGTLWIGAVALR